jgi:hypothetical protein
MSIRSSSINRFEGEFVPQVVLGLTETEARQRFGLESGEDDFDTFVGAAFIIDHDLEFVIKHYAGHPPDTFTVYMARTISDIDEITRNIRRIVEYLDLSLHNLQWERADDPDM